LAAVDIAAATPEPSPLIDAQEPPMPSPSTVRTLSFLGLLLVGCIFSGRHAAAAIDPDLLEGLAARALGPAAVSGRISAIDAVQTDPNHIVVGAATGGVWISDNGGLTWTPVFDDQPVASIGAVAINQSNPDIIWVGTGEGNPRNSTSIGGGIFRSNDGGRSWKFMGLAGSERINRIALHPNDPDTVYVAALGMLWSDNEERGIFKTTDSGVTWEKVLYVDGRTGGTDVKIDPFNPDKIYASMWEFRRWPHFFKSGGPGSGMYLSWDGGAYWKRKTEDDGLPAGELGRISFAPSPAQRGRVYALAEAEQSAMLRSDDGGASWVRTNEDHDIAVRPFYYTEVAADPDNADRVYNIASRLSVSIDGGKTFELNPVIDCCAASNTVHIDNHAFWINPSDSRHLIIGNDGGIAISRDRGATWRFVRNLPLSQFYHIAVDDDLPYHVYGGLQDNGSWRGPAEVWENAGIRNLHWQEVGFGDGFDTLPDPENSRRGYAMAQGGYLWRWDLDAGQLAMIRPAPPEPDVELRFNWNAGIAQDPFDPATIYYGSQFVHKSTDRGATWTVISGDLTSNNPDWQNYKESGGLTYDVTAAENFTSILAIAPSPLERGTIWVGTDDGRVHVTREGGETWTRIDERARGVPDGTWVPMITPSPHDAGTAFIVFDNHRRGDMKPYVFRVSDYGRDWDHLATDTVAGYALSVLQDPADPDLLFLGTEFGLWVSTNAGGDWFKFTAGVPTVSVMDMAIQQRENDLVLGTHGRSIYILDDYSALRGLDGADFDRRLAILAAAPGQQYLARQTPSTRFTGSGEFRAANEPYGVLVTFMAGGQDLRHPDEERERERLARLREKEAADAETKDPVKVELTVRDASGGVVRRQKFDVHQGVNRVVWGMEHDGVRPLPGGEPPKLEDHADPARNGWRHGHRHDPGNGAGRSARKLPARGEGAELPGPARTPGDAGNRGHCRRTDRECPRGYRHRAGADRPAEAARRRTGRPPGRAAEAGRRTERPPRQSGKTVPHPTENERDRLRRRQGGEPDRAGHGVRGQHARRAFAHGPGLRGPGAHHPPRGPGRPGRLCVNRAERVRAGRVGSRHRPVRGRRTAVSPPGVRQP
jgi:photosystem II stability/assembly factor-like uncharacterized protein